MSEERKAAVERWLADDVTQDFVWLVMRSAAMAREEAVERLSGNAQGRCEAFRFVLNEIMGVAIYGSREERKRWLAESPAVVEDALALRRQDG